MLSLPAALRLVDCVAIAHVRGRVRVPYLNGKIERSFNTFRVWWRMVLCGLSPRGIQRGLDDYRHWYNNFRPHSALGGRTPLEAWDGIVLPAAVTVYVRDQRSVNVSIVRHKCRGDPRLPLIDLKTRRAA